MRSKRESHKYIYRESFSASNASVQHLLLLGYTRLLKFFSFAVICRADILSPIPSDFSCLVKEERSDLDKFLNLNCFEQRTQQKSKNTCVPRPVLGLGLLAL